MRLADISPGGCGWRKNRLSLNCSLVFLYVLDQHDRFSLQNQHGQKNCHNSHGRRSGWRGRTFYGRRAHHRVSVTATRGQKTSTEDFSNLSDENDHESNWKDWQTKCRDPADKHTSYQNKWQKQNGFRKHYNNNGSRSDAYASFRQYSETSCADLDNFDTDLWIHTSTESTPFSTSVCSNSSLTSIDAPLSPTCAGRCPLL